jgi:hypothetical protein
VNSAGWSLKTVYSLRVHGDPYADTNDPTTFCDDINNKFNQISNTVFLRYIVCELFIPYEVTGFFN